MIPKSSPSLQKQVKPPYMLSLGLPTTSNFPIFLESIRKLINSQQTPPLTMSLITSVASLSCINK